MRGVAGEIPGKKIESVSEILETIFEGISEKISKKCSGIISGKKGTNFKNNSEKK